MKKIKFALLLNDKPCRSLEDIRENFNAEDIIKNFDNGVLLKWLKIYNLDELYDKALLIDKNSETKLNDLLNLFFEDESKKLELKNKYKEEKERQMQEEKRIEEEKRIQEEKRRIEEEKRIEAEKQRQLEEERKNSYESVTNSLIENKTNYNFIKDTISENHKVLMENYSNLFYKLNSNKCIFGILSVLANEDTRDYFLNDKNIMDIIKNNVIRGETIGGFGIVLSPYLYVYGSFFYKSFNSLRKLSGESYFDYLTSSKIKIYKGIECGESRKIGDFYLIVENKKCLIIYLSDECFITSSTDIDKVYSSDDVNDKFLILDGITFKSGVSFTGIIYMEI